MRACEFLKENYSQNLETDLMNIIVGARGAGANSVKTGMIVNQLSSMGYSVDVNSLLPLLNNNPAIANATPEMVAFANSEYGGQDTETDAEDNEARVSDMAQQATKIG